ncbi:IspD/TarI family cytidylyltransferase [Leuconostoc mesenteroides]|uniref:2-C-methyl-D-erythritol 4-phosphate cytidylyltransferase n=1 Tax=Leuconostoc mesenteroides TaxID=1245 RepID=A0A7S7A9U1_LEUME|nr:IspD/TarI family cytidylyltransferase [Leuconostoc mesenteroides]MBZ1503431.1 2-C-methyl-D-erythritol 4-phosphate cytidylyltransferase [Leuconostoc mesenteroides]QOW37957.1 2-C-methyl-D-erythritol 4-phosphate cytidylyltransferase [Leuconostoc mesenteroides]
MMNIGVIFAGGVGSRMRSKGTPKQFLIVNGKPIIAHTIQVFQDSEDIDAVVVSILEENILLMEKIVKDFHLTKVSKIVAGGKTGQLSIYNGLEAASSLSSSGKDVVLIHDGVRPLIDKSLIRKNIDSVNLNGSAITTSPAKETFLLVGEDHKVEEVVDRKKSYIAKAPQSFFLEDILKVQKDAISKNIIDAIDSSTLMSLYNKRLFVVEGPYENIKITTPDDFYMFKALFDARENAQIFGI